MQNRVGYCFICKNCTLFLNSITETNDSQTKKQKFLACDVNAWFIRVSANFAKATRNLYQHTKDDLNTNIAVSASFKNSINGSILDNNNVKKS